MPDITQIAVAPENPAELEAAAALAARLGLSLATGLDPNYPLILMVTSRRLELRQTGAQAPGPVYVDFLTGKADYRRRYGSSRDEGIVRAVASKKNRTPTVLDATGGLGRDAFVLAAHGCRVTLVERHPVIAALLADGLRRAEQDEKVGTIIRERMRLVIGESLEVMRSLADEARPEVVYLDPMYPHQDKSAQIKKEMAALRMLAGPDQDSASLLETALVCASQRVVGKRPTGAPPLAGKKPDLIQSGAAHRFDIYLTKARIS